MTIEDILAKLQGPKKSGTGWQAKCPAHEDGKASLSVAVGNNGGTVLFCHAGCSAESVCQAIGLKLADLSPATPRKSGFNIVATYDYTDETGKLLFQVCRLDPKSFRQRRPDPSALDGWNWSTKGVRRVPFRLPQVLAAVREGKPVYVCEGEKDVLRLEKEGFSATCNPGGAGKWLDTFSPHFAGAKIVVIADRDEPGRKHAQDVAAKLKDTAASVRALVLPDVDGKPVKDAFDFFAAGGTPEQLQGLVANAPKPEPATDFDRITAELRGEIIRILCSEQPQPSKCRQACRVALAELVRVGRLYYHPERRDFESAMFFNSHPKTLLRIRSDAFVAWLSEWLAINRQEQIFRHIQSAIETAAISGSLTTGIIPEAFWASRPDAIYLSCGDGRVAKIAAAGTDLVDNGTDGVLFAAGRTLAPWQPAPPRDIFRTASLFANCHTTANHAPDLLRLWAYSLPTNPRSKAPLCLAGEIGSGKTRIAKGLAEFYGLPFVAHKVEESAESDFWPCCDAGGIFVLDNADTRCRWLADAVASAATDGCSQRRKLYTNSETVILRARAWIAITTANPTFASDSGLADRLLLVRMARRDGEITSDARLTDEILQNRDAGLTYLTGVLQKALADTAPTPEGLNKRHPDFAAFAVRIGRAMGRTTEAIDALKTAESDKSAFCLENDPIASALLTYVGRAGSFHGTAADLVPHLIEVDSELRDRVSAKRLGKRLNALWPHLKATLQKATREQNRDKVNTFTFQSAGFAGFQTVFS